MATGRTIDSTVLRSLASGDATALADVYERFGGTVYAIALRFTGDGSEAMDILQNVFVALPESVPQLRVASAFDAWLRRVAVRASLSYLRERETRTRRGRKQAERKSADEPGYTLRTLEMERAIADLPPRLRVVFVMKAVEGFAHAEIAETLGISRNASLQRMHRARAMLRETLGEQGRRP